MVEERRSRVRAKRRDFLGMVSLRLLELLQSRQRSSNHLFTYSAAASQAGIPSIIVSKYVEIGATLAPTSS